MFLLRHQFTILMEKILAQLPLGYNFPGNVPNQFCNMSQVILIPAIARARVRLKQKVSCGQFKRHACSRPDVRRWTVPCPYDNLQRAVLAGLDIVCEVVVLEYIISNWCPGDGRCCLPPNRHCLGLQSLLEGLGRQSVLGSKLIRLSN